MPKFLVLAMYNLLSALLVISRNAPGQGSQAASNRFGSGSSRLSAGTRLFSKVTTFSITLPSASSVADNGRVYSLG